MKKILLSLCLLSSVYCAPSDPGDAAALAAVYSYRDLFDAIKAGKNEYSACAVRMSVENLYGADENGNTALIMACKEGSFKIVEDLIFYFDPEECPMSCADYVNHANDLGETALSCAQAVESEKIVTFLKEHEAEEVADGDVDDQDEEVAVGLSVGQEALPVLDADSDSDDDDAPGIDAVKVVDGMRAVAHQTRQFDESLRQLAQVMGGNVSANVAAASVRVEDQKVQVVPVDTEDHLPCGCEAEFGCHGGRSCLNYDGSSSSASVSPETTYRFKCEGLPTLNLCEVYDSVPQGKSHDARDERVDLDISDQVSVNPMLLWMERAWGMQVAPRYKGFGSRAIINEDLNVNDVRQAAQLIGLAFDRISMSNIQQYVQEKVREIGFAFMRERIITRAKAADYMSRVQAARQTLVDHVATSHMRMSRM